MLDTNLDFPTYNGKMDPYVVMDWVDSLMSFFDYKDIVENQSVSVAKSRLKCFSLTWQNFSQDVRVKKKNNPNEKEEIEDEDSVWNLKTNTIPKGVVELERFFDNYELA